MKEYKKGDIVQFIEQTHGVPIYTYRDIPERLIKHGSTIYHKDNKERLGEIVEKYEDLYIVKVLVEFSDDKSNYIQLAFDPEKFRIYKEASNYINYDIY